MISWPLLAGFPVANLALDMATVTTMRTTHVDEAFILQQTFRAFRQNGHYHKFSQGAKAIFFQFCFQLDSRAPETQLISAGDWVRNSAAINPAYLPLIPNPTPFFDANLDRTFSVKSVPILLSACLKAQRIIYTRFRTKFI